MDHLAKLVSGRLKAQSPTGSHPGPEALTAFAENALPEAERGPLLQHLGACSDCRDILYLALPASPEAQKVLVPQPRPFMFRKWALGWGALVASVAVAAILITTIRMGPNHSAKMIATAPAGAKETQSYTETKIAAGKAPQELDQFQATRDALKPKMAVALEKNGTKPHPEAKHMTGEMRTHLEFEDSEQVRVQSPATPANAVGVAGSDKDERKRENPAVGAANGSGPQSGSAGEPVTFGYAASGVSKPRADQQDTVRQSAAPSADADKFALTVDGLNVQSTAHLARKSTATGNLGGTVLDPSGAVVGNAKVTMVGPIGEKIATSDHEGRFSFDRLTPGAYSLKAEASGFKATEIKQLAVLDNKLSNLQVKLEPGNTSEVVEVTAAEPAVAAAVVAPQASAVNSTNGAVAQPLQTSTEFSLQKAAPSKSRQRGMGIGTGSGPEMSTPQWTLSAEGAVQHSNDNGKTWQAVSVAPDATFRALSAVAANIWVGGRAGALYHSADSGQTWIKVEPVADGKKLDQDIQKVDFADALNGTVSTAKREVWATSDGGRTWQRK
jgi:hypothetical protein